MKRKKAEPSPQPHNIWQGALLILIVLAIVVIALMFIAWAMPSATNTILGRRAIETPVDITAESAAALTPTSETESIVLTNQEDVGYGDGIIIASGVLLLILLVATFREIVLYRKLNPTNPDEYSDPSEKGQQDE
ncbi:MAG: hypothetical protein MUO40_07490 [Anaerolineaceae bacterium]|nr:hypothetical protein [Anaerolineaceae bacterium]